MSIVRPRSPGWRCGPSGPFCRGLHSIKLVTRSPRGSSYGSPVSSGSSIPAQRPAGLVLDDARLEEILFLLEIDHLRHPGEGIGRAREQQVESDLLSAPVGDVTQ